MAVKVGSVVVIENDAKINWNKIKGAPAIPNAVLIGSSYRVGSTNRNVGSGNKATIVSTSSRFTGTYHYTDKVTRLSNCNCNCNCACRC